MEYITETKLREKGQLTVPFRIRNLMNLKAEDKVLIFALNNEMIIRPKIKNPLKMAGMLGKEKDVGNVKDLILKYKIPRFEK